MINTLAPVKNPKVSLTALANIQFGPLPVAKKSITAILTVGSSSCFHFERSLISNLKPPPLNFPGIMCFKSLLVKLLF